MKTILPKQDQAASKFTQDEERTSSVSWTIASLSLSMLLSSLGTSIANVGLPTLAHSFNASFQQVQWVVLAYLLAITTLIVSVGRFGDVIGRRRLLLGGIFLFTMASVLCSVVPTLSLLIAARVVQGLGAAIMMALTMAFVGEAVPKEKAGSAMGLLGTMSAVGTALGPSIGGVMIGGFGWRSIFFINLPLGLLTLVLAYRFLPVDRPASNSNRARFDHLGTILLALTLGAYALAMTIGRGNFGTINVALLLATLVGFGLFVFAEMRATSPLIRLTMFRNPLLSGGFATSTLVTAVVMATLVVGPFYLSGALGLDAAHVGLVMSSGPIVAALTGVPAGRLVDRFGAHSMSIAGLVGMLLGSSALPMLPTSFGIPGYIAPLAVITAGYALFQAANNTAVMTNIQADQRGVISGMLNLSRNLGLITGASLMGTVFSIGSATTNLMAASPDAVAAGMRLTFTVAAVLIAIALYIAYLSHSLAPSDCDCAPQTK
ncbi:MAG: MFS transporter [Agitococcus sp.]|nr:MFS transporter [Agitococcus sp.]